jgi:nucleotide-binding universal stress UspA family protein
VVTRDDPAEAIARRAAALAPCVVCLATRGRGRVGGALLGSVARSVVQLSEGPVVVLGPSADNPGWWPRPRNWPEPLSVPRMVACVDGSPASEQILPVATAWAEALGLSLTVLTVIEDAPPPIRPDPGPSRFGAHADAHSYVEHLVEQWSSQLPDTTGDVVSDPLGPAAGIRAYLERNPAGLLALTTSARSGVQRLRLGATAAGIIHASTVPCLVAPVAADR